MGRMVKVVLEVVPLLLGSALPVERVGHGILTGVVIEERITHGDRIERLAHLREVARVLVD